MEAMPLIATNYKDPGSDNKLGGIINFLTFQ